MMLAGKEYEKNAKFKKILRPYLNFIDGEYIYELEDAPDEVKKTYEEYLKWKKKYEGFG